MPPSGPVNPLLHSQAARVEVALREVESLGHATQVATAVAPAVVEYVPVAQDVHNALPVLILYLPTMQAVHTTPFGPVNPTSHVQLASAALAVGELELPGHATQVVSIVAPAVVEYVAATQALHVVLPVVILYWPAVHAEHTPPLGPE